MGSDRATSDGDILAKVLQDNLATRKELRKIRKRLPVQEPGVLAQSQVSATAAHQPSLRTLWLAPGGVVVAIIGAAALILSGTLKSQPADANVPGINCDTAITRVERNLDRGIDDPAILNGLNSYIVDARCGSEVAIAKDLQDR